MQPFQYDQPRYYAGLPYTPEIHEEVVDGSRCYTATNKELPGCRGMGKTAEEAIEDLNVARYEYIASMIEDGVQVPLPQSTIQNQSFASPQPFFTIQPPVISAPVVREQFEIASADTATNVPPIPYVSR